MNKDALAKYALKTFVGSQQQQKQAVATRNEQVELQQKQAKKHWWSRSTTTRPDSILSIQEQKLLKRVKNRAHFLDRGISLCCFQVGFDGLVGKSLSVCLISETYPERNSASYIGFVPVIGDFIGLLMALNLVHTCMEADLPNDLVSRMMFNIAFDFVVSSRTVLVGMIRIVIILTQKGSRLVWYL